MCTPSVARQGGAPNLTDGERGCEIEGGCWGAAGAAAPPSSLRVLAHRRGDDEGGNALTVTEDFSEDLAVIHEEAPDDPFVVEQHGIDFIP